MRFIYEIGYKNVGIFLIGICCRNLWNCSFYLTYENLIFIEYVIIWQAWEILRKKIVIVSCNRLLCRVYWKILCIKHDYEFDFVVIYPYKFFQSSLWFTTGYVFFKDSKRIWITYQNVIIKLVINPPGYN